MKLNVCYKSKQLINESKIINYLKEQLETEIFQQLINLKFKKIILIQHVDSKNQIRYIWERQRDKNYPHGNVRIFCSGGLDFGTDDAGSV